MGGDAWVLMPTWAVWGRGGASSRSWLLSGIALPCSPRLTWGTHSFSYVNDSREQELGRRPWKVNTDLRNERLLMLRFTMEATQLCMVVAGGGGCVPQQGSAASQQSAGATTCCMYA